MPVNVADIRLWADTRINHPVGIAKPEFAQGVRDLTDWAMNAADLLRTVLPMCDRGSVLHDQITELLVQWQKANER